MDQRLSLYLNTKGKILPADIADFTAYGPKSKLCVFCEEPHLKYRILHGEHKRKVFCCSECDFEIESTLDEDPFTGKDPRSREELTIAQDALILYLDSGLFPSDVHKFCLKGELSECCVFCGKSFTAANGGTFLTVPQGPDQTNIVCSDLQICKWCTEDLILLQQIRAENTNDEHFTEVVMAQCTECEEYYPITVDEDEFRIKERKVDEQKGNYTNQYYCNKCLEKHWGQPRFQHIKCNDCKKQIVVDLLCNITFDWWVNDVSCEECRNKNNNHMIEIPIPREDGDKRDEVKVVITSVTCGESKEIRWNYILAYIQPVYAKQVVENSGNSYSKCRGDPENNRAECGCFASAADAAYKGTIEALEFYKR